MDMNEPDEDRPPDDGSPDESADSGGRPYRRRPEPLSPHASLFSAIDMPTFPQIDMSTLFPTVDLSPIFALLNANVSDRFAGLMSQINRTFAPQIESLARSLSDSIRTFYAGYDDFLDIEKSFLPPNLRNMSRADRARVADLMLDERLPFAWVPPEAVVVELLSAGSATDRRKIIVRRRRAIIDSCDEVVNEAKASGSAKASEFRFARDVIAALRGGHFAPAQALATNHFDTLLHRRLPDHRADLTRQTARPTLSDFPVGTWLTVGAAWASHKQFRLDQGDTVPREFSRHASAHAVSPRQYTRANAIIAVMYMVAMLRTTPRQLAFVVEALRRAAQTSTP